MAAILKLWCQVESLTPFHIYWENNSTEFHPNPIWNDRGLGFFENNNTKNKMSSDIRSVADLNKSRSSGQ